MTRATRLALLAGALALAACAQVKEMASGSASALTQRANDNLHKVTRNAVDATKRGDISKTASFSMEQEFHVGRSVAASVVTRLAGRPLAPEHPAARYLRDVGTTVALAATELRQADDRPYPLRGYRFLLLDAPAVNAVGTPGGFVVVTTGALRAARSEDEVAAVLAHEIAHVQRGHTMIPVERARTQEHLTTTLLEGTDDVVHAFFGKVVTASTDFVLDKGFGKTDELAADAFARRVLAGAGYDPEALQRFLSRLQGKAAEGGFFSRHPPAADRVAALAAAGGEGAPGAGAERRAARFEAQRWTLSP